MPKSYTLACGALLASLAAAASAQEIPSLKGTWTGERERISATEGYRDGSATLVVAEQRGMTFKGQMAWSTPSGEVRVDLVGAVTPGGKLMAGADAEGNYSFALVDANTLDYCYAEHGAGFRTTCARLVRKP
jgi:hypothetical protein